MESEVVMLSSDPDLSYQSEIAGQIIIRIYVSDSGINKSLVKVTFILRWSETFTKHMTQEVDIKVLVFTLVEK